MKRISNLFAIVRSSLLSVWAMLRWLSDDKTAAQLTEAFDTAAKIATRVIRFYSESSGVIRKAAKIVTSAADQLSELSPEMEKVAESYITDVEALTKKPKPAKAADRPKRKYTRRYASITIATVTKPAPRSTNPTSPTCTPADCSLCDKPCGNPLNKAGIPGILGR